MQDILNTLSTCTYVISAAEGIEPRARRLTAELFVVNCFDIFKFRANNNDNCL